MNMAAFKVLSRSTNIKSSSTQSGLAETVIPSSGRARNPQLFAAETSHGTKRKRDYAESDTLFETNDDCDFSHPRVVRETSFGTSRKPSDAKSSAVRVESAQEASSLQVLPSMAEEECRRVLKSHKIKIMNLSRSQFSAVQTTNTKKHRNSSQAFESKTRKKQKEAISLYPEPVTSFSQLGPRYRISKALGDNIEGHGYILPTEVQLGTLPLLMQEQTPGTLDISKETLKSTSIAPIDLLTIAPTGSGKTLAFLIPLIHGIIHNHRQDPASRGVKVLIVAPTKELVTQIVNEGRKLTAGTGVRISAMRKGMRLSGGEHDIYESMNDESLLATGSNDVGQVKSQASTVKCEIVVSTPLQLVHASSTGSEPAHLPSVKHIVLDEADVLLDPLFREQTMIVWSACSHPDLRVSLWSATMGSNIEELARSTISRRREALGLSNDVPLIRVVVGLKDSAIPNVSHKLVYAATEQGKLMGLRQLLHPTSVTSPTETPLRPPFLVFTQTISRAVALRSELAYDMPAEAGGSARITVLHSDLSDAQRSDIMARFRKGEVWVLITTDLLSRGVDFRGINGVVNYDIPNSSAAYVHRVGRTGRAGRSGGVAVTFYTKEDIPYVKNVANVIVTSEKTRGKSEGAGIQQWLLDALPNIGKKDRKELKQKGVGIRRNTADSDKDRKAIRKSRISTKSGYDRRLEHNRKDATEGSRAREEYVSTEEEWAGFDN